MFRKLVMLCGALTLSGCFAIETGATFRADGMVNSTAVMSMDRKFYDMGASMGSSDDFCEEGELIEAETSVSCVFSEEMTLEEAIAKSKEQNSDAVSDQDEPPRFVLEEVSPGQVLVEMPIGELMDNVENTEQGAMLGEDPTAMFQMLGITFDDKFMHFWVQAPLILESTEEITEEGTKTEIKIPMRDFFTGDIPSDRVFRVVLKYN